MRMYVLLIGLLFFTCSESAKNYSISDTEMVDVLVELHLAEAKIEKEKWHLRDSLRLKFLNRIAEMHNLDKEELSEDIRLLQNDPDRAQGLYQKVTERLLDLETKK